MSQRVGQEEIYGSARETNEGFLLLKGSKVSHKWAPKMSEALKQKRESVAKDTNNHILEDVLFNSPSMAAMFLIGQRSNGLTTWKTKDGKTLKEFREEESKF